MAKIHLIGTIHYEFKGKERLEKALKVEKPEIVTVEASQPWLDYLDKSRESDIKLCLQALRERNFSEKVLSFFEEHMGLASSYEVDVCRNYSNENSIPLHFIDDPNMIELLKREILSQFNILLNAIDPSLLDNLSRKNIIKGQDYIYKVIQDLYDGKIPAIVGEKQIIDPQRGVLIGKRDETEAKNLTELAQNHDAKILHVGGCMHNLTDSKGETLYSRLKDLEPTRKTLIAYD